MKSVKDLIKAIGIPEMTCRVPVLKKYMTVEELQNFEYDPNDTVDPNARGIIDVNTNQLINRLVRPDTHQTQLMKDWGMEGPYEIKVEMETERAGYNLIIYRVVGETNETI